MTYPAPASGDGSRSVRFTSPMATPQPALDSPVHPLSSAPRFVDANNVNHFTSLSQTHQNSPYIDPSSTSSYALDNSLMPTTNTSNVYSVPIHAAPIRSTPVHSIPIHAAPTRPIPHRTGPVHINEFAVHTSHYPNNGPQYAPIVRTDGPHPLSVLANSTSHQVPMEHNVPSRSTMSFASYQIPANQPLNLNAGSGYSQSSGPPPYSQSSQVHQQAPPSHAPSTQAHPLNPHPSTPTLMIVHPTRGRIPVSEFVKSLNHVGTVEIESDCEEGGGSGDENSNTLRGVPDISIFLYII